MAQGERWKFKTTGIIGVEERPVGRMRILRGYGWTVRISKDDLEEKAERLAPGDEDTKCSLYQERTPPSTLKKA